MANDDTSRVVGVGGLTFTYAAAASPAVKELSFNIGRGEIFGLLGPSGAGKSTTQKVLTGLLRHYEGGVSVLGRDLPRWGADYYEEIGVSFELPNHYLRLTGLENLRYFRSLLYRLRVLGQWFDGIRFYAAASSPRRSRRT